MMDSVDTHLEQEQHVLASTVNRSETAAGQCQDGLLPDGGSLILHRGGDELLQQCQQDVVELGDGGVLV